MSVSLRALKLISSQLRLIVVFLKLTRSNALMTLKKLCKIADIRKPTGKRYLGYTFIARYKHSRRSLYAVRNKVLDRRLIGHILEETAEILR